MKYVLTYYGGGMPETDAERAKVMQAWEAWFGRLGSALVDPGNPTSGNVATIAADGSVSKQASGPRISGYTIIEAPSLDEAVAIAKDCPVLLGGASLAVNETIDVMAATGAR
jgi:hypothetical protein